MNLHQMVSGAIGTVNPFIQITVQRAMGGYVTDADGWRNPAYETFWGPAQVQDLSTHDLKQIEVLNLTGVMKKVYLNGSWAGVVRADQRGGDLFYFNDAEWLATQVLEGWPDWTAVLVVLQANRLPPTPGQAILLSE
jgi:hypothetical protein